MITVEMSDDIRQYENKTVGPFTSRQVATIALGSLIALPIAIAVPFADATNKIFLFAVILIPFLALGFAKSNGGPMEIVGIRMLYFYFMTPRRRKIIQKNEFYEEIKARKRQQIEVKLSKMPASERKKYEQIYGTAKNKKVKYSARADLKVYR